MAFLEEANPLGPDHFPDKFQDCPQVQNQVQILQAISSRCRVSLFEPRPFKLIFSSTSALNGLVLEYLDSYNCLDAAAGAGAVLPPLTSLKLETLLPAIPLPVHHNPHHSQNADKVVFRQVPPIGESNSFPVWQKNS